MLFLAWEIGSVFISRYRSMHSSFARHQSTIAHCVGLVLSLLSTELNDSQSLTTCTMFRRFGITSSAANEIKYHEPEEENTDLLRTLGPEVEMKTFKTNVPEEVRQDEKGNYLLKMICVGGYTAGVDTKGLFVSDYMRTRPVRMHSHPLIGVDFYLHRMKWQTDNADADGKSILLQLWEIAEQERVSTTYRIYFKGAQGALVFWGPNRSDSLREALIWKDCVQEYSPFYKIPLILITDNTRQVQWIGPGKMFESTQEVDEFCRENDFITWYEVTSRDWDSGEDSVFGGAVHRLVREILEYP